MKKTTGAKSCRCNVLLLWHQRWNLQADLCHENMWVSVLPSHISGQALHLDGICLVGPFSIRLCRYLLYCAQCVTPSPPSDAYQYVSVNWISIGSGNGLLSIENLGTNFSEIWIKIQKLLFMKMHLNVSAVKWRPFYPFWSGFGTHWANDSFIRIQILWIF